MESTIQLPPIPASILGISNIIVENAEITKNNEFIITVRSTEKEILCQKCGNVTSPHGHSPAINLRHLAIFGKKTYIQITPARGRCDNCKGSPTTTQTSSWYNKSNRQTKVYEEYLGMVQSRVTHLNHAKRFILLIPITLNNLTQIV